MLYRTYYTVYGENFSEDYSFSSSLLTPTYGLQIGALTNNSKKSKNFRIKLGSSSEVEGVPNWKQFYNSHEGFNCFEVGVAVHNVENFDKIKRCPQGQDSVNLYLGIYSLITVIILINLIIAVFTTTYEKCASRADQIWKFQRTELVHEYNNRPRLPPPLSLISFTYHILKSYSIYIFKKLRKLCTNKKDEKIKAKMYQNHYRGPPAANDREIIRTRKNLQRFERVLFEDAFAHYLKKRAKNVPVFQDSDR